MGRFSKLERSDPSSPASGPGLQPGAPAPASVDRPKASPMTPFADRPSGELEPNDYPSFIQRADDLFFTGDFEKALRFYSRALQVESNHQDPWIGQIECLLQLRQLNEADLWVNRGLELFPDDPSLLSSRAVVMAHRGMTKRALGISDYAMTRGATPFCWIARGEVLLLADHHTAAFSFEKALELSPSDDWKLPFRAGLSHFRNARWAPALQYFQKAVARNASNFWLWYLLGVCFHRLSFRAESIDALQQSISMNPGYPPAQEAMRIAARSPLLQRLTGWFHRLKSKA